MESLSYNPNLVPWERPAPNNVAGKGHIEQPGKVANIVWQTRATAERTLETMSLFELRRRLAIAQGRAATA